MAQVTASTSIRAAPESVWALMCDPNRYPELSDATDRMLASASMLDGHTSEANS